MAKKQDIVEEYLRIKDLQRELSQKDRKQKQVFNLSLLAGYLTIIALIFSGLTTRISLPFVNKDDSEKLKIATIENRVAILEQENNALQESLKKVNQNSLSYIYLNNRISELNQVTDSLNNAVLMKPGEIVTARLLTDKHALLGEQFLSLKEDFNGLSSKVWQLFIALIIGILVTIFGDWLKEKFLSSKNTPKNS